MPTESTPPESARNEADDPQISRLFFAWQPDEATRARLAGWQERLGRSRQLDGGIRWLSPEQLHMTLLFLGDVAADRVDALVERVGSVCDELDSRGIRPTIELDRLGFFPRRSRPRVLVLAGQAGDGLRQWNRAIRKAVQELVPPSTGQAPPLKPHVTLGRVTAHEASGAKLPKVREPLVWPETPLTLMESQLRAAGAFYLTRWVRTESD